MKKKITYIVVALAAIFVLVLTVRYIFSINQNNTKPYIYKDLIEIDSPIRNQKINSPVLVKGEARGNWYFEATFPVQILDGDGTVLGGNAVRAQGEWTTTNYVPFSGEVMFTKPKSKTGTIVFKKDNPSGLPQNTDFVSIPINFE